MRKDYQNKTEVSATTQMRALLSLFPTDLDAGAEHGGSNQPTNKAEEVREEED